MVWETQCGFKECSLGEKEARVEYIKSMVRFLKEKAKKGPRKKGVDSCEFNHSANIEP